jgi:hypothetical protein
MISSISSNPSSFTPKMLLTAGLTFLAVGILALTNPGHLLSSIGSHSTRLITGSVTTAVGGAIALLATCILAKKHSKQEERQPLNRFKRPTYRVEVDAPLRYRNRPAPSSSTSISPPPPEDLPKAQVPFGGVPGFDLGLR